MKVWLLDTEKFVAVNALEEITNGNMFDKGNVPSPDGLFSTEIFGVSTRDRRETWAYIDLKGHYLAPKVYLSLKRLNRNFESVVYSTKKYNIVNGVLVQDDEKGGTGLEWLYKNWEKIKFEKNDSAQRNERVTMLTENKKDVLFMVKQVVIPAFYRDVNNQDSEGRPKVAEINDTYAKIIRNVTMIQEANKMDFMISALQGKTQDLIVEVYNLLKEKVEKKNGYIRKFLMGKSVDYGSRVVITAAPYEANRPEEQKVNFYTSGIPLSHICSQFTPFIIYWLDRWFKKNIENHKNSYYVMMNGKEVPIQLDNPEAKFNEEYLEEKLAQYVKNPYTRFDTIELPVSKEELDRIGAKTPPTIRFKGYEILGGSTVEKTENEINRSMTWTDLLYMASAEMTRDKHVIITRYPYLDYHGSYISRIHIISTRDTMVMSVNGTIYDSYPVIDLTARKEDLDSIFRDTINVCALYLPGLCGDFDGDQITCKGIFSQEANAECEKIIMNKANLLSVEGTQIRKVGNEGAQTLYSMTAFH